MKIPNLYLQEDKLSGDYSQHEGMDSFKCTLRAHSLFTSHYPLEHYDAEKQTRGLATPRLKTGRCGP